MIAAFVAAAAALVLFALDTVGIGPASQGSPASDEDAHCRTHNPRRLARCFFARLR
jgi:hypothetical protein